MEQGREVMILTCGSEEIIIETNDFTDDESVISSCASASDYEEIETEEPISDRLQNEEIETEEPISDRVQDQKLETRPPVDTDKQSNKINLPNPYVKLNRCDHLMKGSSYTDLKKFGRKSLRSSSRLRRPNRTYESRDFLVGGLSYKSSPIFKKQKHKKNTNIKSIDIKPNNTLKEQSVSNSRTDLKKNVSKEYQSDYKVEDGAYDFKEMNPDLPRFSNDFSAERLKLTIKEEPPDYSFNGMAGRCVAPNFFITYNSKNFELVKPSKIDVKTVVKTEPECSGEYPENNSFIQNIYDIDTENVMKNIKVEHNEDSSESEVDVEKVWEGPVFITDSDIVSFDHSYSLQQGNTEEKEKNIVKLLPFTQSKKCWSQKKSKKCKQTIKLYKAKAADNLTNTIKTLKEEKKKLSIRGQHIHSISERLLRAKMRESFTRLRDLIPNLKGQKRASKQSILDEALNYIISLENAEGLLQRYINALRNTQLNLTLKFERLKRTRQIGKTISK